MCVYLPNYCRLKCFLCVDDFGFCLKQCPHNFPYLLEFKNRLAIFEQNRQYFLKILIQFLQSLALRMRAWKSRNKTNKELRLRATFDDSGIGSHGGLRQGNRLNFEHMGEMYPDGRRQEFACQSSGRRVTEEQPRCTLLRFRGTGEAGRDAALAQGRRRAKPAAAPAETRKPS
jgi:hypothetical protein